MKRAGSWHGGKGGADRSTSAYRNNNTFWDNLEKAKKEKAEKAAKEASEQDKD